MEVTSSVPLCSFGGPRHLMQVQGEPAGEEKVKKFDTGRFVETPACFSTSPTNSILLARGAAKLPRLESQIIQSHYVAEEHLI